MSAPRIFRCVVRALAFASVATASRGAVVMPVIPLCPGLTIVTAVNQQDGDYESIKTIESVTDAAVRLKYSVERRVSDFLSTEPPKLQKFTLYRTVRRQDLKSASLYLQQFSTELPETIPQTTAIGTSTAVLNDLKTRGTSPLGIFITFTQIKPSIDRNVHPNVYDNQMISTVKRVGTGPVKLSVLVNDVPTDLPAIRAHGNFFGDESEFFFLDDPANPLALEFHVGIGGRAPMDPGLARAMGVKPQPAGDKEVLKVTKIAHRCATAAPGGGDDAATQAPDALEQSLARTGRAQVYSIYFSFDSDGIRAESGPTLQEIAGVLRRHPDWRLAVNGHTDNIGGDQYNLDLSARRAAAVRRALAVLYAPAQGRLTTAGYGRAQPVDTNDTLEGRARNRRVELVRLP
jgi:outer membrane protein OmpA-like peptidoglycan-associated protein